MRILRVAQTLYPESKGGGAYHVHAMSRDQAEMGHEVTVLTVGDSPTREEREGYTVIRRPALVGLLGNAIAPGIARFLRQARDFDVIHAHSHLYFSTNLAALTRWIGDTPLAITNHGLYSQTAPKWVFDVYLRTLGRWTFDQADVVFTYTDAEREELRELGIDSDIAVVANGIDTRRFTPNGSESELVDSDGPVILFVGRLVEGKRPVDVVRALSGVRQSGIDATLYVAGEGPLESEMRSVATEMGIRDEVRFLGHISYDEMPDVYRTADILVLPSRDEGLPRTILEAMASGVPVVASHLEQTAPIVREAGETVEVGDIEAYVTALDRILHRTEELGKDGRRLVVENFLWEDTVARTTAKLEALR